MSARVPAQLNISGSRIAEYTLRSEQLLRTSAIFEPVVEFPPDPYEAAAMFLAVLAYPELGAGQPEQPGAGFARALWDYLFWCTRKEKGLRHIRRIPGNENFRTPEWKAIKGPLNRGLRRIDRRLACYDLMFKRVLLGFMSARQAAAIALAQGNPEAALYLDESGRPTVIRKEVYEQTTPSDWQILGRDVDGWAEELGLNMTGRAADDDQRRKDLIRRAIRPSRAVLHMAHAFREACDKAGPKIGHWDERVPALALLLNADLWIDEAISAAEMWRQVVHLYPGISGLTPGSMIELSKKSPENAT